MFGIIALTLTAMTAPEEIAIVPQPFIVAPGQGTFTLASDTIIVADHNELEEARYINEVFGMNLLIDGQSKNKKRIHINMDMRFAKLGEEGYRLDISPAKSRDRSLHKQRRFRHSSSAGNSLRIDSPKGRQHRHQNSLP
ncbi:MAG: glycoside hydrolase family 20 zincin-like fold domain-containing protein [Fimbriimonadaceae bacterium]